MSILPLGPVESQAVVATAALVAFAGRRPVAGLIEAVARRSEDLRRKVRRGRPDDSIPRRTDRVEGGRHLELLVVSGVLTPGELLEYRGDRREAGRRPAAVEIDTRRAA